MTYCSTRRRSFRYRSRNASLFESMFDHATSRSLAISGLGHAKMGRVLTLSTQPEFATRWKSL